MRWWTETRSLRKVLKLSDSCKQRWLARFAALARLDDDRVLVEQLKLIHASMNLSLAPMFPAMLLLVVVLNNGSNLVPLLLWLLGLGANNTYVMVMAHRWQRDGIEAAQARGLVAWLMLSITVGGFAWGMLAWGALGNTSLAGNVLVIGVLAGILGGAISLLSPVPAVFVALAISLVGTTVAKLWQLDDPAFNAFGVIAVLFLGVLCFHSRNASVIVRAAILLRFENLALAQRAEAARLAAVQANTAKSRFLAAASHDLRQPIHAQGLFLEVLLNTPLNPQQLELVGNVRLSRDSTAEMLDVLLDFSRIEAGVVQPQVQIFAVLPVLNRLEREFSLQADAKGLVYRSRETPLAVQSDPGLVELIVRNLVSNAIRYTNAGGLLVTCRRRGNHALVEVRDTGIGIAPDQHQAVFQEFHQLANPERDSRKGLGLGLAIADGLARVLGTSLRLKSALGRGSTFSLCLPLAPASSASTARDSTQGAAVARQLATSHRLLGLRVLLIDDDALVRTAMQQLLVSWGCECNAAESIEQALLSIDMFAPQVLVCDYRLREQRSGAQAIAAVRAKLGCAVPSIIVTGDTAPDRLREALAVGVPLLHKPLSPHQLRTALQQVIAQA